MRCAALQLVYSDLVISFLNKKQWLSSLLTAGAPSYLMSADQTLMHLHDLTKKGIQLNDCTRDLLHPQMYFKTHNKF